MTNIEKIIIAGIVVCLLIISGPQIYLNYRGCKQGHTENQMQMPVGVVVGGGKYGGGTSIPIGNAKEVQVFVCDIYN